MPAKLLLQLWFRERESITFLKIVSIVKRSFKVLRKPIYEKNLLSISKMLKFNHQSPKWGQGNYKCKLMNNCLYQFHYFYWCIIQTLTAKINLQKAHLLLHIPETNSCIKALEMTEMLAVSSKLLLVEKVQLRGMLILTLELQTKPTHYFPPELLEKNLYGFLAQITVINFMLRILKPPKL